AVAFVFFFAANAVPAEAKTITIKSPEDLRDINWANKGFGPGNTYVIGADMTLGDGEYATCRLTKGKFTIDFNGHTVQNANNALGVFSISGAEVIFKDSKVSSTKPSVRSYGAGAIDMTAGKLTINSGNYLGLSNGTNNPCALHVGGGTCIVNGGFFYGDTIGADCTGAKLYINGGTFQTGFWFALADFGNAAISVAKGNFIGGTTTYGYHFSLGALSGTSQTYNFGKWLAKGSSFSPTFQTGYWNLQSSVTAYPTISNYYAVAYDTQTLAITSSLKKPAATAITKIQAGTTKLKPTWKKKTGISGYEVQFSTNKKFTNAKTVRINDAKTTSKTVSGFKSGKTYYVRVRTFKTFNGRRWYSKWSTVKAQKTK
ncbi:MAG: fibronectin type III domain-containing protein, partial [bacterium]